jgi:hypothetical protein
MKILPKVLLFCLLCFSVSCGKKGPYGYDKGEVYIYYDDKGKEESKFRVEDSGDDYITIRNWDYEKNNWRNTTINVTAKRLEGMTSIPVQEQ